MPRKKGRKTRSLSQEDEEDCNQIQNPIMIEHNEQDEDQPQPSHAPNQEEDHELHDLDHDPDEEEPEQHEDQQQHQSEPESEEQSQQQALDEPEGMDASPTILPTSAHDTLMLDLVPVNQSLHTASNVSRKAPKRRKPMTQKKRAALEKNVQILKENLQPIPFAPSKTLDFSKHEKLFRFLGLWEFVHLELDRDIRIDLLAQLIANYSPQQRCSYLNEMRIAVSRADLARALQLPVKKDKHSHLEAIDTEFEVLADEAISFIEDFVSNWILLHEDTWMMPDEILSWTRFIKEGQPQKVDWPGLIWFMVEKELIQGPNLLHCYYASHLQCLMKFQREGMFREDLATEVSQKEEEYMIDIRTSAADDFHGQELEKHETELSLGQEKIENDHVRDADVMDFQECKGEETEQWLLGPKNVDDHFLQRCNLKEGKGLACHPVIKEGEEEEERFNLLSKSAALERLSSADFIQDTGTVNIPYSLSEQLLDHSNGNFLSSRVETHMSLIGSSVFGNVGKREASHEHDVNDHCVNEHHKRMRNDGPWDHKSSDFDVCLENMQNLMGKARMMYIAKEQACTEANINQQVLLTELQQRESMNDHLHKTNYENLQRKQTEVYRLERELYVMGNLLDGYRKALKETRRAFSEYRKRHPHPDEPLYKDVGETGGVVLSTMELEKQRLEQEEEDRMKRLMIGEKVKEFEIVWFGKLDIHLNKVHLLGNRLLNIENEVKLLLEMSSKHKISDNMHAVPASDEH